MKIILSLTCTVLTVFFICLFYGSAQYEAHTQWNLPEGAKARLGKGEPYSLTYSPDGTCLAIPSSIGIWIVDVHTGEELALLTGHTGFAWAAAYSPDGSTLASTSNDGTVCLWNTETGERKAILTGHTDWVRSVVYNPDGSTLTTASWDKTVRLWDAETGNLKSILTGHTDRVHGVVYSPDDKTLASLSRREVLLWDVATEAQKTSLTHPTQKASFTGLENHIVNSVAYSPDGKTLATGSEDKTVRLWDAETGNLKSILTGHTDRVHGVVYSPDDKTLASLSRREVLLWDVATEAQKTRITAERNIRSVAYSPDGKTLTSGSEDGTVELWDAETGKHVTTLVGHIYGFALVVTYGPDGKTLASWSDDGTFRLWDAETGNLKSILTGYTGEIYSVAYSPDGATLATAGTGGMMRFWDTATGKHKSILTEHTGGVYSVAYSPDGTTLVTAGGKKVVFRDAVTGEPESLLSIAAGGVHSVMYSPDGSTLAIVGSNRTIEMLYTSSNQRKVIRPDYYVSRVAYSPDGKTLAIGGSQTTQLRDVDTGQHQGTLPVSAFSLAYSPDGTTLTTVSFDDMVRLWDPDTGKHKATFRQRSIQVRALPGRKSSISSVVYSSDGATLAITGMDRNIVGLWDAAIGVHKATLIGHTNAVRSLAYSPDGTTLATAGIDGTTLLWALTPKTATK